jgi:hypothetical protein
MMMGDSRRVNFQHGRKLIDEAPFNAIPHAAAAQKQIKYLREARMVFNITRRAVIHPTMIAQDSIATELHGTH